MTILPYGLCYHHSGHGELETCALTGVAVEAQILDFVAEVTVTQYYYYEGHSKVEAQYRFPLEESAAVCSFDAEINGKLVLGIVQEKMEARTQYKKAVREGHGAYLMEQDTADTFSVTVGNLPPQTRCNIRITYVEELRNEEDWVKFVLPTTIGNKKKKKKKRKEKKCKLSYLLYIFFPSPFIL